MRNIMFSESEQKAVLRNTEGEKVLDIEFNAIKQQQGGIVLYICEDGDLPFEPDSKSAIKISVREIVDGAIDWQQGTYLDDSLAILDIVNELEHIVADLKLRYQDSVKEGLKDATN